jgi:hypothetical protein
MGSNEPWNRLGDTDQLMRKAGLPDLFCSGHKALHDVYVLGGRAFGVDTEPDCGGCGIEHEGVRIESAIERPLFIDAAEMGLWVKERAPENAARSSQNNLCTGRSRYRSEPRDLGPPAPDLFDLLICENGCQETVPLRKATAHIADEAHVMGDELGDVYRSHTIWRI